MVEISFIIPVYNGEKTIEYCLESIGQCNRQIEIIVVNDGSTDSTKVLCNALAKKDERIQVVTIANSGQSIARNHGLQMARGKYICWVDADDTIIPENVEKMYEFANANKIDVIMGGYIRKSKENRSIIHLPGDGYISRIGEEPQRKLYHRVKTGNAFGYVWNKLYRRSFLKENDLQMDDIRKVYMEDTMFNIKAWTKNPTWYCINMPVYCYDVTNESTTRKSEPLIQEKYIAMISELVSYMNSEKCLQENLDLIAPLIMRTFCWSLIKNVSYEGVSFSKIRMRAKSYMDTELIQQVLKEKGSFKSLWKLSSVLQSIFFCMCFLLLRWRMDIVVASMFVICCPLMKVYIRSSVK